VQPSQARSERRCRRVVWGISEGTSNRVIFRRCAEPPTADRAQALSLPARSQARTPRHFAVRSRARSRPGRGSSRCTRQLQGWLHLRTRTPGRSRGPRAAASAAAGDSIAIKYRGTARALRQPLAAMLASHALVLALALAGGLRKARRPGWARERWARGARGGSPRALPALTPQGRCRAAGRTGAQPSPQIARLDLLAPRARWPLGFPPDYPAAHDEVCPILGRAGGAGARAAAGNSVVWFLVVLLATRCDLRLAPAACRLTAPAFCAPRPRRAGTTTRIPATKCRAVRARVAPPAQWARATPALVF